MKIASLKRLHNDRNGNPACEVTFAEGIVARTVAGFQVGYQIENSENQGVELEVTWRDGNIAGVAITT